MTAARRSDQLAQHFRLEMRSAISSVRRSSSDDATSVHSDARYPHKHSCTEKPTPGA